MLERVNRVERFICKAGRQEITHTRAVDMLISKTDQVRQALCEGRNIDALRIAKGFRMLGDHKQIIQRGWSAYQNPNFHRQLKHDPEALVSDAIASLRELYGEN